MTAAIRARLRLGVSGLRCHDVKLRSAVLDCLRCRACDLELEMPSHVLFHCPAVSTERHQMQRDAMAKLARELTIRDVLGAVEELHATTAYVVLAISAPLLKAVAARFRA
jgi:hypothetical protein